VKAVRNDGEGILRHGGIDVGAQARTDAVVERGLDRRQAVPHCHLDGSGDGDAGAGVLE
jgi:hypothetical protein